MIWSLLFLSVPSQYDNIASQFPIIRENRAIVDDAIARWSRKVPEGMDSRVPMVVYIIDERCVILHVMIPSLGTSPVYCYKMDADEITRWDDGSD